MVPPWCKYLGVWNSIGLGVKLVLLNDFVTGIFYVVEFCGKVAKPQQNKQSKKCPVDKLVSLINANATVMYKRQKLNDQF